MESHHQNSPDQAVCQGGLETLSEHPPPSQPCIPGPLAQVRQGPTGLLQEGLQTMDKCPVPPDRNHHSHGDTDSKQESSENGFHMKIYRRKLPEKPVPQSNPVGQDTEQFHPPPLPLLLRN